MSELEKLLLWLNEEMDFASHAMKEGNTNYWFGRYALARELLGLLKKN